MNQKVINIMPNAPSEVVSQCERLVEGHPDQIYKVFIGFPLLFSFGEEFRPVALIICNLGILFFTRDKERVDDEEVFLRSQLVMHPFLRKGKELRFEVIPRVYEKGVDVFEVCHTFLLEPGTNQALCIEEMRYIESALTGMLTKNNQKALESVQTEDPVLEAIRKISYGIATFDQEQYRCIEARSDTKVTAIRGLAGCGKTVVLCKIAANELSRNREARICYTYQTRSMYGQAKERIRSFLIASGINDYDSAMARAEVMGAWGGFNNPGLLNKICHELDVRPLDLVESKMLDYENPFLAFSEYVEKNLRDRELALYDYVLVDEAQDLNPAFLRICLKILKPTGKLIYAYDDFQTLSEVSLPTPKDIFNGEKSIQSFPLSTCYRTPAKILSLAHALSMGIYCDPPVFYQFPAKVSDWEAMGYVMEEGSGKVGQRTVLSRKSPGYYDEISVSAVKSISPKGSSSAFDLLADQLRNDLDTGLQPEDVLVIDLDGAKLDTDFQLLNDAVQRSNDKASGSKVCIYPAGGMSPDSFRKKGYITFSGVKRAKGNEAFRVYLLNAAKTMSQQLPITWRNRLFTAMTRTRLQLVFVNPRDGEQVELTHLLFAEMKKAKEKGYKLEFVYPSRNEVKKIIETAKMEERVSGEVESISNRLKQVSELAGNEKMVGVLGELISSSLSPEEINTLLSLLTKK